MPKRTQVTVMTGAWPAERGDVAAFAANRTQAGGPYATATIRVSAGTGTFVVAGNVLREDGHPSKLWEPIVSVDVDSSVKGGVALERFAPGSGLSGGEKYAYLVLWRETGTPTVAEAWIMTGVEL